MKMNKKEEKIFDLGLGEMFRFIKNNKIDISEHNLSTIKEAYENRETLKGRK